MAEWPIKLPICTGCGGVIGWGTPDGCACPIAAGRTGKSIEVVPLSRLREVEAERDKLAGELEAVEDRDRLIERQEVTLTRERDNPQLEAARAERTRLQPGEIGAEPPHWAPILVYIENGEKRIHEGTTRLPSSFDCPAELFWPESRSHHNRRSAEHWHASAAFWQEKAEKFKALVGDEAVEVVAEAMWNEREFRDPTGDPPDGCCPPGHDVHQQPPREPFLWEQMVAEGKFDGDQAETRADARRIVDALLAAAQQAAQPSPPPTARVAIYRIPEVKGE